MLVSRSNKGVLSGLAVAGFLAGCSAAPREGEQPYSAERYYERACDSASRSIDNLMVHWENLRSSDRMPAQQIIQARQAMGIITPVCENISAVLTLDAATRARVDAAFRTIESAARNLPRLPAGG